MNHADLRLARALMDAHLQTVERQMGDQPCPIAFEQPGWCSRRGRRLVHHLDGLLLALADRLQRLAASPSLTKAADAG